MCKAHAAACQPRSLVTGLPKICAITHHQLSAFHYMMKYVLIDDPYFYSIVLIVAIFSSVLS